MRSRIILLLSILQLLVVLLVASKMVLAQETRQVTVTVKATQFSTTKTRVQLLMVNQGDVSVFLGSPTVTPSNGLELIPKSAISLDIRNASNLHGVTASGSARVDVMEIKQ